MKTTVKNTSLKGAVKNQNGFTLLELLLVVGVGAILLLAGIATYRLVTEGNNVNEGARLLTTVKQQVQRLYQGQNTYGTGNISATLINAGVIPDANTNTAGTGIQSPWNTPIVITAATANFTIAFNDLPEEACMQLATTDVGSDPDFVSVAVGSATAITTTPTVVQADAGCDATAGTNDIVWTFF